jgi:hypothetical protein
MENGISYYVGLAVMFFDIHNIGTDAVVMYKYQDGE